MCVTESTYCTHIPVTQHIISQIWPTYWNYHGFCAWASPVWRYHDINIEHLRNYIFVQRKLTKFPHMHVSEAERHSCLMLLSCSDFVYCVISRFLSPYCGCVGYMFKLFAFLWPSFSFCWVFSWLFYCSQQQLSWEKTVMSNDTITQLLIGCRDCLHNNIEWCYLYYGLNVFTKWELFLVY